ncbi:hypothetical protein BJY21_003094 [Kineosphaera limosa]|uniref:LacI family transcriptional regulator n=1 Tax=Kineosphaera limosa NBRC 100340 TaxID=1184609 RepID=K6WAA4_9MICO|nr:hypothetical protein [Kineosphaera limosa]NYE01910.1 hypothetical protein [Kineosphaera limosa]GAB96135.1 hypothetical protein KILIM_032_00200 [Kineosphaera limosa NBRC 100340]
MVVNNDQYVGGPHRSWSEIERRFTLETASERLGLSTRYAHDESGTYEEARLLGSDDALPIQTRPRLSTIRLRFAEGIREAVRLLTAAPGPTVPEERVLLPATLCLRET